MTDEKRVNEKQKLTSKEHIKAGDIKGKIDVHDTRDRRDGPGGN